MINITFWKIVTHYALFSFLFCSMLYLFGYNIITEPENSSTQKNSEVTSRDIGIKAVSYNGCRFLIFFAKEPKGPFTVIPDPTDCGCEKQKVSPITPKAPTEQKEKEGKPRQKEI